MTRPQRVNSAWKGYALLDSKRLSSSSAAARVVLAYLLISILWIVASDLTVYYLSLSPETKTTVAVLKGWAFVAVSALAWFLGLRAAFGQFSKATNPDAEYAQQLATLTRQSSSILWKTDSSGRFLAPNFAWEEYTGQRWPAYQGRGWLHSIHEHDRGRFLRGWEAAVKATAPLETLCRIWHDQSREYRRSITLATPVESGESGSSWICAMIDLEELLQANELLAETERRLGDAQRQLRVLDRAIEQMPVAVVVTDTEGVIEYVNPAFTEITGFARDDAVGSSMNILKSGAHDEDFYRKMWDTITSGKVWRGQFLNRRSDGKNYWESAIIAPVRIESTIEQFIAIKQDITKQREMEEQFRHAQKMEAVGQLASGVAHDFNNLLTVIGGYAEILYASADSENETHEFAGQILAASERATALTRQLLAFSRKTVLDPRLLVVDHVVSGLLGMVQRVVGEHIECRTQLEAGDAVIFADPTLLDQALLNLIVNARDAMAVGGVLTLSTKTTAVDKDSNGVPANIGPGSYAVIAVADTGVGMDEQTMEHIFDPFFTTKQQGKGTGLGLSMVHGFVHQSGGGLHVDSTPGDGTCFYVYLPLKDSTSE